MIKELIRGLSVKKLKQQLEKGMGGTLQRKPQRRSKKRSNPYAERGLDKFALVSAELEAKREKLVAQLGTSLSLVRFVIGSDQRDWIPVIVCPSLSKAEIRTLKRTATQLLDADDRPALSSATAHQIHTPGVSHAQSTVHARRLTCYDIKDHDGTSSHDQPAHVPDSHADDAHMNCCQIGALSYLLAASARFLWMAAFTFSVATDIISSALLSKRHAADVAPQKGVVPSTRRPKEQSDSPSATSATSPMHFSGSLQPIRTRVGMSAKDVKVRTPSHSVVAHVEAAKTHNRCKGQGFSTAPSTPRDSRQVKKSFHASVSFPTTTQMRDEAPRSGNTKDSKFLKSISLPKTSHMQEPKSHVMLGSHTSMSKETTSKKRGRKERSENLGQALTGAGLAVGLSGLVMGYIPAIICIVCWWYALPSLRKAVGDEPHVESHHL